MYDAYRGNITYCQEGSLVYCLDCLERHMISEHYRDSVKLMIMQSSRFILCLEEQSHHTNYPALLDFAELLAWDYFEKVPYNSVLF